MLVNAGEPSGDRTTNPRIKRRLLANGDHSRRPEQSRTARPMVLRRLPRQSHRQPRQPSWRWSTDA